MGLKISQNKSKPFEKAITWKVSFLAGVFLLNIFIWPHNGILAHQEPTHWQGSPFRRWYISLWLLAASPQLHSPVEPFALNLKWFFLILFSPSTNLCSALLFSSWVRAVLAGLLSKQYRHCWDVCAVNSSFPLLPFPFACSDLVSEG